MPKPPYTDTEQMRELVAHITEQVETLSAQLPDEQKVLLRRGNRIRTIQGSLAIEGNTLSLEQVTAVIEGKQVLGSSKEVQEVRGAIAAYEALDNWEPDRSADLLAAHLTLMQGLVDNPGSYRGGAAGIKRGDQIVHVAPPAEQVAPLMNDLLAWVSDSEEGPLIKACVFHYEFEFIHPFVDGNGRMGRLWQTLILSKWHPLFALVPVESLIRNHQEGYYQAINVCDQAGNADAFINFMLEVIYDALVTLTHPATPQVTPQVAALLTVLNGTMDRAALQAALNLKDRKSFRDRYLKPALDAGLIEMTLPDKPTSSLQKYVLSTLGEQTKHSL